MDTSWKKIIFYVLDVVLAFYLVMAVTSWNTPDKSRRVCTKVNINISDSNNSGFLSAKEIKSILEKDRRGIKSGAICRYGTVLHNREWTCEH